VPRDVAKEDMFNINITVCEETLTGWPHDTSVQKATSDNENVDAV